MKLPSVKSCREACYAALDKIEVDQAGADILSGPGEKAWYLRGLIDALEFVEGERLRGGQLALLTSAYRKKVLTRAQINDVLKNLMNLHD